MTFIKRINTSSRQINKEKSDKKKYRIKLNDKKINKFLVSLQGQVQWLPY